MSLSGKKVVHSESKSGSPYLNGYNPANFIGTKEITIGVNTDKERQSTVAEFLVKKIDGTVNMVDGIERPDSVFLLDKDGNVNEEVVNSLLTALGLPPKADGEAFTDADQAALDVKGKAKTPVSVMFFPQKVKKGASKGKVFTMIGAFGKTDEFLTIQHASLAGTLVNIEAPAPSNTVGADAPPADANYV